MRLQNHQSRLCGHPRSVRRRTLLVSQLSTESKLATTCNQFQVVRRIRGRVFGRVHLANRLDTDPHLNSGPSSLSSQELNSARNLLFSKISRSHLFDQSSRDSRENLPSIFRSGHGELDFLPVACLDYGFLGVAC